jgi:hypothetical protein
MWTLTCHVMEHLGVTLYLSLDLEGHQGGYSWGLHTRIWWTMEGLKSQLYQRFLIKVVSGELATKNQWLNFRLNGIWNGHIGFYTQMIGNVSIWNIELTCARGTAFHGDLIYETVYSRTMHLNPISFWAYKYETTPSE